ncbi:hypothetical protein EX30DRAFT_398105 [Ascodesmis nigricans]|uniref:Arb2 domain-containing protein n=1 Tax=Ascodesmis nigricans TaxID=341454 RepID=A0A4S2MLV4_9PEZI|nr:hypothetical protein EX30DRAFT_398105 [Ascodesmis nigricans]
MFRRKYTNKAQLPDFPADLEKLGLFINDDDQIRQIENPEAPFEYFVYGRGTRMDGSGSREKMNKRRKEALDECIRRMTLERLTSPPYSLEVQSLPAANVPHVDILTSPLKTLSKASKIMMIFPDQRSSSLGIFAFRVAVDESIRMGNMQAFLDEISPMYDAIVIANPAAVWWDEKTQSAVTAETWNSLGLTAPSPGHILNARNDVTIPGHESPEDHVASVFSFVKAQLAGEEEVERKIDFIGVAYTAYCVLSHLAKPGEWEFWGPKLNSGVLAHSPHKLSEFPMNMEFRHFLNRRVRNYLSHGDPKGTFLADSVDRGCAVFSSEVGWEPRIVPDCLGEIVNYFVRAQAIHVTLEEFEEEVGVAEPLNPVIMYMGDEPILPADETTLQQVKEKELKQGWVGW